MIDNKLKYEDADILITLFTNQDIITASTGGDSGGGALGGDDENDGGWTER